MSPLQGEGDEGAPAGTSIAEVSGEHIARSYPRVQARAWKVPELVAHLNIDRSTVYRYIHDGRLGAFRTPGGTFRIPDSEVQRITTPVGSSGKG